eukprot:6196809-Pleurochrysis_carterae.AAC.1
MLALVLGQKRAQQRRSVPHDPPVVEHPQAAVRAPAAACVIECAAAQLEPAIAHARDHDDVACNAQKERAGRGRSGSHNGPTKKRVMRRCLVSWRLLTWAPHPDDPRT